MALGKSVFAVYRNSGMTSKPHITATTHDTLSKEKYGLYQQAPRTAFNDT
jgi:hypothetical protein